MASTTPTAEQIEDILLSCRYGELDEVKDFVATYGVEPIVDARDERGNTVLHMCCGNGHQDLLEYLIPRLPASLLQTVNTAGTPPLHWAILNNHINTVKYLVELPAEQGGGVGLLHQKSAAGREAFEEALFHGEGKEEVAGWIEGYLFKVEGGDDIPEEGIKMTAGQVEDEGADKKETSTVDEVGERVKQVDLE